VNPNGHGIDDLLRSLPPASPAGRLDPALLEAIRKPLLSGLTPVKPLPGTPVLALAFCALFATVTVLCSHFLGFAGWRALSLAGRTAVFGFLLAFSIA
jgi:hypothetical protein